MQVDTLPGMKKQEITIQRIRLILYYKPKYRC